MSLSRLQLAAALLEYDNLDAEPSRPLVSHRDSALFKPYKPRPLDAIPIARAGDREAYHSQSQYGPEGDEVYRRARTTSQYSSSTIPPPPAPQVDLDRWDLPEHLITKDPDGHTQKSPPPSHRQSNLPPRQNGTAPSRPLPITSPLSDRINSVQLDVLDGIPQSSEQQSYDAYEEANEAIARAQRVQSMYDARNPTRIPLPPSPANTLSFRSLPGENADMPGRRISGDAQRPGSVISRNSYDMVGGRKSQEMIRPSSRLSRSSYDVLRSPGIMPQRPGSSYSMLDQPIEQLNDEPEDLSPNPFALPPPPPELGSRFDPKIIEAQRKSIDLSRPRSRVSFSQLDRPEYRLTLTEEHLQEYLSGKSPVESSLLDGREFKTYKDVPTAEEYGKPLRAPKHGRLPPADRRSLLRPKTLIMPSLLSEAIRPPSPPKNVPEGYTLGDKPLPPGSRSSILTTEMRSRSGLPLSLSQKTFRSSLIVGGKREDEEYWVGGTTNEGEVGLEYAGMPDPEGPIDRRPGKLYGKSLMDQLEARKAALKSKQRAFAGDLRPAMMARGEEDGEHPHSALPRQPLLTMDPSGDIDLTENTSPQRPIGRMTKSRSVFGVDTIWEKEMAKLKVIQEAEARATAAKEAAEREKEALEAKKKEEKKSGIDWRRRKSGVEYGTVAQEEEEDEVVEPEMISPVPRVPELPPQISYSPEKAPRAQIVDPITGNVKGDEDDLVDVPAEDRHVNGEEERDDVEDLVDAESVTDSEEDVPLSHIARPETADESDSEEDVPLSQIKPTISPSSSVKLPGLGGMGTGTLGLETRPGGNESDEDDVPLMVRKTIHLTTQPTGPVEDVEDDLPLGFKHADAVVRQNADQWRSSMTSPHGAFHAQPQPNPMMQWGQGQPMMSPYGYNGYPMPNMGMGYPSPSMPNLMGMGWPQQPQMVPMPMPMSSPMGMPMGMPLPMGMPTGQFDPEQASKNIDSWRQGVAVPSGAGSVRSESVR